MHWQEALNKSEHKAAKRINKKGIVYYRFINGACVKFLPNKVNPIIPKQGECDGYMDWIPA